MSAEEADQLGPLSYPRRPENLTALGFISDQVDVQFRFFRQSGLSFVAGYKPQA